MKKPKYFTHKTCIICASMGLGCCSRCQPFVLFIDVKHMLRRLTLESVMKMIEVSEAPPMYWEHLSDPEMAQIYYPWRGKFYRLQMKFINGSCIALKWGEGCILAQSRPLICKVWPFWWAEGGKPTEEKFPIEVNGECTMAILWGFPTERLIKELDTSESQIRLQLKFIYYGLSEHYNILQEALRKNIPPNELLRWIIIKARK